jgi:hypothetical protein
MDCDGYAGLLDMMQKIIMSLQVWTLNQNLALYGQKMEGDEVAMHEKQREVEGLSLRVAETEATNRDKDMVVSDMQRKLDNRCSSRMPSGKPSAFSFGLVVGL